MTAQGKMNVPGFFRSILMTTWQLLGTWIMSLEIMKGFLVSSSYSQNQYIPKLLFLLFIKYYYVHALYILLRVLESEKYPFTLFPQDL